MRLGGAACPQDALSALRATRPTLLYGPAGTFGCPSADFNRSLTSVAAARHCQLPAFRIPSIAWHDPVLFLWPLFWRAGPRGRWRFPQANSPASRPRARRGAAGRGGQDRVAGRGAAVARVAVRLYQNQAPQAQAWYGLYRWADLFGQTEAQAVPGGWKPSRAPSRPCQHAGRQLGCVRYPWPILAARAADVHDDVIGFLQSVLHSALAATTALPR